MQNWNAWAKAWGKSWGVAWGRVDNPAPVTPNVPGVGHSGPVTFEDPNRRNKEQAKELLRINNEALVLLLAT